MVLRNLQTYWHKTEPKQQVVNQNPRGMLRKYGKNLVCTSLLLSTEIKERIRVTFTAVENVNLYQVIQGFVLHDCVSCYSYGLFPPRHYYPYEQMSNCIWYHCLTGSVWPAQKFSHTQSWSSINRPHPTPLEGVATILYIFNGYESRQTSLFFFYLFKTYFLDRAEFFHAF